MVGRIAKILKKEFFIIENSEILLKKEEMIGIFCGFSCFLRQNFKFSDKRQLSDKTYCIESFLLEQNLKLYIANPVKIAGGLGEQHGD